MALALAAVTAITWGTMEVIFLKAAKGIGAFSLVLWLAIMGTVVALPIAMLTGRPEGSTSELVGALAAAALGFGAGALYFVALQHGQLSVVSPIVATQAAVAALAAALLLGEPLGWALAAGLLVVLVGTVLAAGGRGRPTTWRWCSRSARRSASGSTPWPSARRPTPSAACGPCWPTAC